MMAEKRADRWMLRFQAWALLHLPASVVVRPAEWFISFLCFLSGLSIVTGAAQPRAAEDVLPEWMYYGWAAILVVGSMMLFCGLSSIRWVQPPVSYALTRTPCFRLGLKLLGLSSLLYMSVQLIYSWPDTILAAGMTLLFSCMCWARLLTVGSGV